MKKIILFAALLVGGICNSQNLHWLKPAGGANNDHAIATSVTPDGRILTLGHFAGTVDFDPGPGVTSITEQGQYDVFLTCFSPAGNFLWVHTVGGSGAEQARDLAIDSTGAVYIIGSFASTGFDADLGPGFSNIVNASTSQDGFIIKYNASGNFCWAGCIGGVSADEFYTIDVWGPWILLGGVFNGTADLHPAANIINFTSNGAGDAFMTKLDTTGAYQWTKTFGANGTDEVKAVAFDNAGNAMIAGAFFGTVDFDPSPTTLSLVAGGQQDAFVGKYDLGSGNPIWVKHVGGVYTETVTSLEVDALNNVYYAGNFFGDFDINADAPVNTMYCAGSSDAFASKLDAAGNYIWGWCIGGTNTDDLRAMSLDGAGNMYFTGSFRGTADFNPSGTTYNLTASGGNVDLYVLKMTTTATFVWAHRLGGGNAEEGNGIWSAANGDYYLCGRWTGTVDMDPTATTTNFTTVGLSDAFVAKYSMCPYYNTAITVNSCGSYTSPSGNYVWTSSGTYIDTMQSVSGCDSLITVTLAINSATTATVNAVACPQGYISPSGNYLWTAAGTYMDTVANAAGCDSAITVNLTLSTIDVSVTNSEPTLTANQSGAIYQWIDCGNGNAPIAGATSQSYMAPQNGNYAVIVTMGSCSDTSACEAVTNTGNASHIFNMITFYPNPATQNLTIEGYTNARIIIANSLGQEIRTIEINGNTTIDVSDLQPGVYFLKDSSTGTVLQFVKQ